MNQKILLLEPNYKNKYPPMGLMKLATYYRGRGDDVRFYKGDLKKLAAHLLCEEFLSEANLPELGKYVPRILEHISTGRLASLEVLATQWNADLVEMLRMYRDRYRNETYPQFDVIAITTLFTFYWRETIGTIISAKKFRSKKGRILVGGISSSILPERFFDETGIMPICGLLDKPGILDIDSDVIIDELPLDYSILEEVDYEYPSSNAYLAYMTRGCPRRCAFCAVPTLEPKYKDYIGLKEQIQLASERFGPQKDLLLMDNNVFASKHFHKIIDEIKECGFERGAYYVPASEYVIAMKNLLDGHNVRGYIKKFIKIYDLISEKLAETDQADFFLRREELNLLYAEVANVESIIAFDEVAQPLYEKLFKRAKRTRRIDFNQGVDARLVTEKKMTKLAEINIKPLRIAFDDYSMKETYIHAVRLAVENGIKDLSNYLLYNYEDKPEELYYRMRINIDLCDELGCNIFSFPMKYHPIADPEYFQNRDYVGKNWNRKFIRAIQAILNATKGKVGRGKSFFDEAFGRNVNEFFKILWMPEAYIIHRFRYKDNLTSDWWEKYGQLDEEQSNRLREIVAVNQFRSEESTGDSRIDEVLKYYQVTRG